MRDWHVREEGSVDLTGFLTKLAKMGQGLTLLAPELAQRLSSDRLATFYECEAHAEETNMNSVETYLFLTAKYEYLLREQHDAGIKAEQDRLAEEKNKAEVAALTAPIEAAQYRAKVAQMCRFTSPMQKRTMRTPVITSSVKEKSQPLLKTTNKQSSTKSIIDDTTHATAHESEEVTEPVEAVDAASTLLKVSFGEQFACKLCNKDFSSQRQLDNHIGHSQLHAKALNQRNLRLAEAYEHAQKLSQTLRRIASGFIHVKTLSQVVPSSGRERFIRAVKRVIDANRLFKFKVDFPDFKADQSKTTDQETSEDTQTVIYEGTKFFWRVKSTCRVVIISHSNAVLEMITHPLPTSLDDLNTTPITSDDTDTVAAGEREGCDASSKTGHKSQHGVHRHHTHHAHNNKLSGSSNSVKHHHTHSHADNKKNHAHHQADKEDKEEKEVQRIYLQAQIIRELALPSESNKRQQQQQTEEEIEAEHKLIASFLLSRLKIDYLRHRENTLQAFSVYFDTPRRDAPNTPLLTTLPPGIIPYPKVDVHDVRKQWQLALRMKAIERSQQKMAVAVARQHNIEQHQQSAQTGSGLGGRVKTPHHTHHHANGGLRYGRRYKTLANTQAPAPAVQAANTTHHHHHQHDKEAKEEHHRLVSEKFPRNDHINPALPPVLSALSNDSSSMKRNMSRPLASLSRSQSSDEHNEDVGLTLPSLASRSMDQFHNNNNPFDPSTQVASQQLQKQLSYQEQRKRSLTRQYTKVACLLLMSQSRSHDDYDGNQAATGGGGGGGSRSYEEQIRGEQEHILYLDDKDDDNDYDRDDFDDDLDEVDELPVMPLTRDRSSSSNYTSGESYYAVHRKQGSVSSSDHISLPPIVGAGTASGSRSTSIDSVENNAGTTTGKPTLPSWMSWKLHGDFEVAAMNALLADSPEAPIKEEGRPTAARLSPLNPVLTGRRWTFDA